MRTLVLSMLLAVAAALPTAAQSDAELTQVVEGFGRGQCNPLTHQALNPETGRWMNIDPSPWTGWTIKRAGPGALEYVTPGEPPRLMEFEDGVYRDRAPDGMEDAEEWTIVEHAIHGSDNWRIVMTPPEFGAESPTYAELIIAGDIFIWTNSSERSDGSRVRFMYFACRFAAG